MKIFLRTPFNYDTNEESDRTGLVCKEKTLTEQHHKDECDVNFIVERALKTGEIPAPLDERYYGDYSGEFDYAATLRQVNEAQRSFMTLPAKVRSRFDNNPQKLLEFLADQTNREEAEAIGLVNKRSQNEARTEGAAETNAQGTPGTTGVNGTPQQGQAAQKS